MAENITRSCRKVKLAQGFSSNFVLFFFRKPLPQINLPEKGSAVKRIQKKKRFKFSGFIFSFLHLSNAPHTIIFTCRNNCIGAQFFREIVERFYDPAVRNQIDPIHFTIEVQL